MEIFASLSLAVSHCGFSFIFVRDLKARPEYQRQADVNLNLFFSTKCGIGENDISGSEFFISKMWIKIESSGIRRLEIILGKFM